MQSGIAVSVLFLLLGGGFSLYTMSEANSSLTVASLLDKQGIHAEGIITGGHVGGSRATVYYLDVKFQVDGRTYTQESPVSQTDYKRTNRGSKSGVVYLPSEPKTCRLEMSVGPQMATNKLIFAYILMMMAIGTPMAVSFALWWTRRRELLLSQ